MRRMTIKVFMVIGLCLFLFLIGYSPNVSAASYYDTCTEGNQEDGSYLIKVSKESMKDTDCNILQKAFYEARDNAAANKQYIIVVEPAVYNLDFILHMYRYTTLYAQGCTFNRVAVEEGKYKNMLIVGDTGTGSDTKKGYYYEGITVDGGVWNGNLTKKPIYRAAHCKNLLIQNAVFKSCVDAHLMEVAALDGFTVKNCVFQDGYIASGKNPSLANEAIQIDITVPKHFPSVASEIIASKNITIQNNTFENVLRGVGSHTAWIGLPYTNVTISDNTFSNVKSVAIECLNYQNCLVENNTLKNCGRGISVFSMTSTVNGMYNSGNEASKTLQAKTVVRNNTIQVQNTDTTISSGIAVQGKKLTKAVNGESDKIEKGNYVISDVSIYGNTIKSKANGIILRDAKKISLNNNRIDSAGSGNNHGILISDESDNIEIQKNRIISSKAGGITVKDSKSININKNNVTVNTAGTNYGILSTGKSKNIKVGSNEINVKGTGIVMRSTTAASIQKNKITGSNKADQYGILISADSKKVKVGNNTIKKYKKKILIRH